MSLLSQSTVKNNALMSLFKKRPAVEPLPQKKPTKKVKISQDKINDPLYHILSWRDDYKQYQHPQSGTYQIKIEDHIPTAQVQKWGKNFQGILININWQSTTMEDFKKINLSNELLSNGMAFVWGTKTNIGTLMDYFEQMGYNYAENFIFVMLSRNKISNKSTKNLSGNTSLLNFFTKKDSVMIDENKKQNKAFIQADYQIGRVSDPSTIFLNTQSQYFSQSQKVLYMFRKINKKESLELRHQRTSDVYFTIGDNDELDWKAKEIVYKMIETLLINANYKEKEHLKLLQLWGNQKMPRKGWVTVAEREQSTSQSSIDDHKRNN